MKNEDELNYCIIDGDRQEVSSGFKIVPGTDSCVFCPICHACKNETFDAEKFELNCKHYGDIPTDFIQHEKLDCKYFVPDESCLDWPVVKQEISKK